MRKKDEFYIVVFLNGGKQIRLKNEQTFTSELLSRYDNAIKAELYQRTDRGIICIDDV